ncbi:MAG: DinB family protein [Planctomycetota bacterium]|jgi:hypothetical protein|nr:DinB family protein [Planctomycetota bacterium]
MLSEILHTYTLNLRHLRRLVADLDDAEMVTQTGSAPNHAAWIIGHLIHSCEAMCGEIGVDPWLTEDWRGLFGTGSTPLGNADSYPSKGSLLTALDDAYSRLSDALSELGESGMLAPLPDMQYRKSLPTIGHALVHILASHTALHVGQLTVWRKAIGLPRVPEQFDHDSNA